MHADDISICSSTKYIVSIVKWYIWPTPEITKGPQTAKRETEIILRYGIYRKLPSAAMQRNVT